MILRFFTTFMLLCFVSCGKAWAIPIIKSKSSNSPEAPTILKADSLDADELNNNLIAEGNVEANKGNKTVYADKMTYKKSEFKGGGIIKAIGNVRAKDLEMGNLKSTEAELRDDFSSGKFYNNKMVFVDGSYLTSPEMEKVNPKITVVRKSVMSLCPDEDIIANNDLAGKKTDMISMKSSRLTMDKEEEVFKVNNGVVRLYNVPFLYLPYFKTALPSKKRKSGFLPPSYAKSTNLGTRIITPYFVDMGSNMDMTISPYWGIGNNQLLVNNELRHSTIYGDYNAFFEIANNKITNQNDKTIINRTKAPYRWNLYGKGIFDFTKNTGLDFDLNTISDRYYLRDYHISYYNFTTSKVNFDYINGRSYHAARLVRIQEIENSTDTAPTVFPILDSHIETAPGLHKEKYALTSNFTKVTRTDGLQYNRATVVPEFNLPFNVNGNLFTFNTKMQTDFYSLQNKNGGNLQTTAQTNFDSTQYNYKPEISFNWRLPLMKKNKSSSFLIEPIINIVSSSYRTNYQNFPAEDASNTELTISNMFLNDRIAGYDRNEVGTRATYGLRTSYFNKLGEFGLTLGQSYRKSYKQQDVTIRGFNAGVDKSNIVGQASYKTKKHFAMTYTFQLDESTYRNDVNELTTMFNFDRFTLSSNYLVIRKTPQNPEKKQQFVFGGTAKINNIWDISFNGVKDIVNNRYIQRSVTLTRKGCCLVFGFIVTESNPSNLVKPQRSFSFNLTFKTL